MRRATNSACSVLLTMLLARASAAAARRPSTSRSISSTVGRVMPAWLGRAHGGSRFSQAGKGVAVGAGIAAAAGMGLMHYRRGGMTMSAAAHANALLEQDGLPKFKSIEASSVVPAIKTLSSGFLEHFHKLEGAWTQHEANANFETVVESMEKIRSPLEYAWGVVNHLLGVKNSDDLRKAHETVQPEVVQLLTQIGQSRPLYDALVAVRDSPAEWAKLSHVQKRIVESSIRDMRLSGVGLDGADRERFKAIKLELSKLSTDFSNHVLDSTKSFELLVTDKKELDGLPDMFLEMYAQSAVRKGHKEAKGETGPWLITLDMPAYLPAMQFLKDRHLREKLYTAYVKRASDGQLDNAPLIRNILKLKKEMAQLLGYKNYAEMSLASKMAPSVTAVDDLITSLREKSYPYAVKELKTVQEYANANGFEGELKLWDLTYWAERMKEDKYGVKEEELRPYFALPNVLEGMFKLTRRIFGVEIVAADGEAEVWHPDVRFFKVLDAESGKHIASFFLDPYSRPENKRGGAWMDVCLGRSKVLGRKPVAYLTCNGSPPVGDTPSLMTFREVETLFHETGHGLQHMLTEVEDGDAAGINGVEWDSVELPSQFMENWCYDRKTFFGFAKHYKTGEPLPEETYQKLNTLKHYNAGLAMLRQLYFGKLDMELHSSYNPGDANVSPFDVQKKVAKDYTVMEPLPEDRFLCSFSHIFAGGYAAGYYSYKWAEVMSADAFAAFEEAGLDNEDKVQEVGRKFRKTVLAMGGGQSPMDVYKHFRGREPKPDALLRHSGLVEAA